MYFFMIQLFFVAPPEVFVAIFKYFDMSAKSSRHNFFFSHCDLLLGMHDNPGPLSCQTRSLGLGRQQDHDWSFSGT